MTPDLIGYRCWRITFRPDLERVGGRSVAGYYREVTKGPPKLRLESLSCSMTWDGPIVHADRQPWSRNSSGLYALKTIDLAKAYDRGAPVYGEVAMFGRVIEHEMGWRAEHMLVKRIWLRAHSLPLFYAVAPFGIEKQIAVVIKLLEIRYQCDVIADMSEQGLSPMAAFLKHVKSGEVTTNDLEKILKEFGV